MTNEIEALEKEISELKAKKKELESKYTFSGLYKRVSGRNGVLKAIKMSDDKDSVKYTKAVTALKKFAETL